MGLAGDLCVARRRRCPGVTSSSLLDLPSQAPSARKVAAGTASISLLLLLHHVTDIASSSLRELDAVALATNDMVFMGRDTSLDDA